MASKMQEPLFSEFFEEKLPSALRKAMLEYFNRIDRDEVIDINLAIGNVPLPMYSIMNQRNLNHMFEEMAHLFGSNSGNRIEIVKKAEEIIKRYSIDDVVAKKYPDTAKIFENFQKGIVMYTGSQGIPEAQDAFRNIIASSLVRMSEADAKEYAKRLAVVVVDGGSMAMELAVLGVCGPAGTGEKPLLLIDPAYTNYKEFADRTGRKTISVKRKLQQDGTFTMPDLEKIEHIIIKYRPGALVTIPDDNPTGQHFTHEQMIGLGGLCAKHNIVMISDEAYRELYYKKYDSCTTIWDLTNENVPGIEGKRISIESASKVWNACGLRIGALVSDNARFVKQALAVYTSNLCANTMGQYIFGALAHPSRDELQEWYEKQRDYYRNLIPPFAEELKQEVRNVLGNKVEKLIVSDPQAAIYCVVQYNDPLFNADEFVMYCAKEGKVKVDEKYYTLLAAPMSGFYSVEEGEYNPGEKQLRLAFVKSKEDMKNAAYVFAKLLDTYLDNKAKNS